MTNGKIDKMFDDVATHMVMQLINSSLLNHVVEMTADNKNLSIRKTKD